MANRKSRRIWVIAAAVVVAVGSIVGVVLSRVSPSPSDSTPEHQGAPDFTLTTMTGANITLSDLEGTPVVLNFWSISCAYCRQQLPYVENVTRQAEGEIQTIAINIVDTAAGLQNFFREYEPAMIIALDQNRATFVSYCQNFDNARGYIPFTLFIDSEGMVRYKKIGAFASEEALREALHDALGITIP